VIGPVVSSERITSRKGLRNTLGSTSERSRITKNKFSSEERAIQPTDKHMMNKTLVSYYFQLVEQIVQLLKIIAFFINHWDIHEQ